MRCHSYPGFDFIARPVVGGEFAILALNSAPSTPALWSAVVHEAGEDTGGREGIENMFLQE